VTIPDGGLPLWLALPSDHGFGGRFDQAFGHHRLRITRQFGNPAPTGDGEASRQHACLESSAGRRQSLLEPTDRATQFPSNVSGGSAFQVAEDNRRAIVPR
jgi:hypothetical protein